MNYLIFDNDIYYEARGSRGVASKNEINAVLTDSDRECAVAVVDTIQKKVAAPEKLASKKDDIIASSFDASYVVQSERIAPNLFQVIAIEKARLSDLYKHLSFENVRLVVPYAVALRQFLREESVFGRGKAIVFLDHMGNQVLLTIFNNEFFTTPRRLPVAIRRIVSEVTRSEENYRSLNKEDKEISFLIATNSKEIMEEIASAGLDKKENIACFADKYPALKGLRDGKFSMHYLLPEKFIRLRRLKILKRRAALLGTMFGSLGILAVALLGSLGVNKETQGRLKDLQIEKTAVLEELKASYRRKYTDILRQKKRVDLPHLVGSFREALPSRYKIESMTIMEVSGFSRFEAIVSSKTKDRPITGFILSGTFKKAKIENVLVKGSPAFRVVLDIF